MTQAEVIAWTTDSRCAQGLPARVEDQELLARLARLFDAGQEGGGDARPAA